MSRMFPLVLVMLVIATGASNAAAAPSKEASPRGVDAAGVPGRAPSSADASDAAPPAPDAHASPREKQERARAVPRAEESRSADNAGGRRAAPAPAGTAPADAHPSGKSGGKTLPAPATAAATAEAATPTVDARPGPARSQAAAAPTAAAEGPSFGTTGSYDEAERPRTGPSPMEAPVVDEQRGGDAPPAPAPRSGPAAPARHAANAEVAAARISRPVTEDADSRRSLAAAAGALGVGLVTAGAAHLSRRVATSTRDGASAEELVSVADAPVVVDVREALVRGQRAVAAGAYESASRWFDCALALDARLAVAHFCQGLCLAELGRHEEAYSALQMACALDPQEAMFRVHLARACVRLERQGEAMDVLAPVVAALPECGEAVLQDDELAALRDHPRFLAMTGAL